jgi:hypothetical protein
MREIMSLYIAPIKGKMKMTSVVSKIPSLSIQEIDFVNGGAVDGDTVRLVAAGTALVILGGPIIGGSLALIMYAGYDANYKRCN